MSFRIEQLNNISIETLVRAYALSSQIFLEPYPHSKMLQRVAGKDHGIALFAVQGNKDLGFKIGFEEDDRFHSWLGGVIPEAQGRGIAKELALRQEQIARELGFSILRTHTDERFPVMIELK